MIIIAAECAARLSAQSLVDLIWSGAEWHLVRFGIKGVAIEYDDGQHQSVQLCVDWQRRDLALSVRRFRDTDSRISFFYSRPPPSVVRQTGIWEAHGAGDVCRLSLIRRLELQRGKNEGGDSFEAREQAYGALLQAHLARILEAVVRPAESGQSAIRTMRPVETDPKIPWPPSHVESCNAPAGDCISRGSQVMTTRCPQGLGAHVPVFPTNEG